MTAVIAHRGASAADSPRTRSRPSEAPASWAPTGSSSTCAAPPTARSSSTTTPTWPTAGRSSTLAARRPAVRRARPRRGARRAARHGRERRDQERARRSRLRPDVRGRRRGRRGRRSRGRYEPHPGVVVRRRHASTGSATSTPRVATALADDGRARRPPRSSTSRRRRGPRGAHTRATRSSTPRSSTRATRAGLAVNVWTVDDPGRIAELAALGVDGISPTCPTSRDACSGRCLTPRGGIGHDERERVGLVAEARGGRSRRGSRRRPGTGTGRARRPSSCSRSVRKSTCRWSRRSPPLPSAVRASAERCRQRRASARVSIDEPAVERRLGGEVERPVAEVGVRVGVQARSRSSRRRRRRAVGEAHGEAGPACGRSGGTTSRTARR